jgi:hypothetical protein
VAVVEVGVVRMAVHQPPVPVSMRVRLAAVPRDIVRVPVMGVVHVRVGVLHRLVDMIVRVPLREVQPYAERHEAGGDPE